MGELMGDNGMGDHGLPVKSATKLDERVEKTLVELSDIIEDRRYPTALQIEAAKVLLEHARGTSRR